MQVWQKNKKKESPNTLRFFMAVLRSLRPVAEEVRVAWWQRFSYLSTTNMLLLVLAFAPAFAIIVYIYIKDKYEREPIGFLLKNILLGGSASVLITFLLGAFGNWFLPVSNPMSIFQQFLKAFVVVALVEEFSKYVIVR